MPNLREDLQATLGRAYTLERELGGGGMSRVFVVEDVSLRRRLVVKVLSPELAADVSLARFEREIGLAARLQHPHIVPLLSAGETQGLPYYTMPFVEGESLRQRLTRGELPVAEAVRLTREIASALAYAHDQGVVHRDVKPENVLLSGGIALVADFGIAKAVADAATVRGGLTGTGIAVGTPAYMSPEQVSADPNLDHRSDIYALGLIAYEMLAGHSPFAGRTAQAMLSAHVIDTPEPLQNRRAAVPEAVAALVMRCLQKRPADRPQHANEIVQALDALITPTGVIARAPRSKRSRLILNAAGAIVVIAAGAGVWFTRAGRGQAAAANTRRLLIVPFENLTGDPRFNHIGMIAADRLAIVVTQRGSIPVIPSQTVLQAMHDTTGSAESRIKRLSDANRAGLIVGGTVVLRGDSLTLQAQVTDARTGKVFMVLDPTTGPVADPTVAVDLLSDRLLGAIGLPEAAVGPRGTRAPKFAAAQEWAAGFELFALQGENVRSQPFFRRAIAIDSTYTPAYLVLLRLHLNVGQYAQADSLVRVIEGLPQGLSASERLMLEYNKAELRGDNLGRLRAQQRLADIDSMPLALGLIGEAAIPLLRPAIAIPALELSHAAYLVVGGKTASSHTSRLAEAYHLAGAHDRERRLLLDDRNVYSDVGEFRAKLLRANAGLRDSKAALAIADTMLRVDGAAGLAGVVTGAAELRAHGDTVSANALYARALWLVQTSAPRSFAEANLFLANGQPDSAALRFEVAARESKSVAAAGYLGLSRAASGNRAGARVIADSLGALQRDWLFGTHTFWKAAILGALGEKDAAVKLLIQAQSEGQKMELWHYASALRSLHGFPAFEELIRPRRD